jgi:hypothetical protein
MYLISLQFSLGPWWQLRPHYSERVSKQLQGTCGLAIDIYMMSLEGRRELSESEGGIPSWQRGASIGKA